MSGQCSCQKEAVYLVHVSVLQSFTLRVRLIAGAYLEILLLRAFLGVEFELLELPDTLTF